MVPRGIINFGGDLVRLAEDVCRDLTGDQVEHLHGILARPTDIHVKHYVVNGPCGDSRWLLRGRHPTFPPRDTASYIIDQFGLREQPDHAVLESAYEWPRVYTTGQVAASCFLRSEDARVIRAHSDNLPAQAALPSPPFLTEANAVDVADKGRAYVTPPSAGHRDLFHPSYYLPVQPPRYGDVQTSVTYLPLPDEDVKLEVQSREPSPPSIRAARLRPTDTWRPARPAQLTNDTNEAGPSRQLLRRELLGDDASIEEEKQDDDMAQRQVRGTHDAAEHREQQQRDADGHPRADRTSLERPMSNRGPGVALGTVADRAEQKAARDAAGAEEEHIDVRRLYGREDAAWWNDMAYAQRQPTALRTENGLTLSVYLADGCRSCTK